VALSNVTIVGGTLANLAFNVRRKHPLRQGPLIDWDLILVMEPSTILGALFGGYLNKVGKAGQGFACLPSCSSWSCRRRHVALCKCILEFLALRRLSTRPWFLPFLHTCRSCPAG
jgi:hypothetical protein